MNIILASKSPRRQELLRAVGIQEFQICPARREETAPAGLDPAQTVCALSAQKAQEVGEQFSGPEDLIIAADTLVCLDGVLLGKPHTEAEAADMLRRLSGQTHQVYTGITVLFGGKVCSEYERTDVCFRALSDAEITRYVASGEPMDKAGAYGVQGRGAVFVRRIEGDYFNVVGLPLCRLYTMLRQLGIEL